MSVPCRGVASPVGSEGSFPRIHAMFATIVAIFLTVIINFLAEILSPRFGEEWFLTFMAIR